jgi:hypothetical protein
MNKIHFFYSLLILDIILQSCSVEKRRYTSGYHLTVNSKHLAANNHDVELTYNSSFITHNSLTASSEKKKGIVLLSLDSTGCDTLIMRDETEIKVKVIEITPTEIKYKYCDHKTGPTYVVFRYNVSYIKYANGSLDSFVKEHAPLPQTAAIIKNNKSQSRYQDVDDDRVERYVRKKSVASIFWGAFGCIPFYGIPASIIAIILGSNCLRKINKDPNLLPCKQKATIGLALGVLGLLLFLAIIVLLVLGII